MSDHQRETAFLRQCILYDDSDERHKLEENIARLQRNERCVRRALGLMAVLIALGVAGVGYSAIFLPDYPQNISRFMTQLPSKASCTLALGSFIGLLTFAVLGARYRKELDQCRENCRRLALNLLEARLGKPGAPPSPAATKETSGEESGKS